MDDRTYMRKLIADNPGHELARYVERGWLWKRIHDNPHNTQMWYLEQFTQHFGTNGGRINSHFFEAFDDVSSN